MRRGKRQDGEVVAVGSCTLASLTDRHASVEALNSVDELPICTVTNIVLINNICQGMKGTPNLDVEKDYSPVLPHQKGTVEIHVMVQSFVVVALDIPAMSVINSLRQ